MKYCLIQQPSGLGDILLSIKIGCHFAEMGYNIVWPVFSVYNNIGDKIFTRQKINFYDISSEYPFKREYEDLCRAEISEVVEVRKDILFVPLKRSFQSTEGRRLESQGASHDASNMIAKFLMCGITHHGWQEYFEILRNNKKERELINLLNIQSDYHVVNKLFGTPPVWNETLNKEIETPKGLQRVEMTYIDGYNVFDWLGVLEDASKIDAVSTSTFYFFEKMDLKCKPTIYSRNTTHRSDEENFNWLRQLAQKEYNFIS